jgi:hypothetical protein
MATHYHKFEKSSFLSNCSYDSDKQELTVVFHTGKSYTYKEVSINTYNDLADAKSAGIYFSQIKDSLKSK